MYQFVQQGDPFLDMQGLSYGSEAANASASDPEAALWFSQPTQAEIDQLNAMIGQLSSMDLQNLQDFLVEQRTLLDSQVSKFGKDSPKYPYALQMIEAIQMEIGRRMAAIEQAKLVPVESSAPAHVSASDSEAIHWFSEPTQDEIEQMHTLLLEVVNSLDLDALYRLKTEQQEWLAERVRRFGKYNRMEKITPRYMQHVHLISTIETTIATKTGQTMEEVKATTPMDTRPPLSAVKKVGRDDERMKMLLNYLPIALVGGGSYLGYRHGKTPLWAAGAGVATVMALHQLWLRAKDPLTGGSFFPRLTHAQFVQAVVSMDLFNAMKKANNERRLKNNERRLKMQQQGQAIDLPPTYYQPVR